MCKFIDPDTTVPEFRDKVMKSPFSRYPMIDEDGGETLGGYVHRADLISMSDDDDLQSRLRQIKQVKANTNIEFLFSEMLRERQHIAVVYDELGTWLGGVVTLEDILETLLVRRSWMRPIMSPTCAAMPNSVGADD